MWARRLVPRHGYGHAMYRTSQLTCSTKATPSEQRLMGWIESVKESEHSPSRSQEIQKESEQRLSKISSPSVPLMESLFRTLREKEIAPTRKLYHQYLRALHHNNQTDSMLHLVREMEQSNIVTTHAYNVLLQSYCQQDLLDQAERLVDTMIETSGVSPDVASYAMLLRAWGKRGNTERVQEIQEQMRTQGVQANVVTFNTLIGQAFQSDQLDEVKTLFQQMRECHIDPNAITFGYLIQALFRQNKLPDILRALQQMNQAGVRLNAHLFTLTLKGFIRAQYPKRQDHAYRALELMRESSFSLDQRAYETLLEFYCKFHAFDDVVPTLEQMHESQYSIHPITATDVISSLGKKKQYLQAVDALRVIVNELRSSVDSIALNLLVKKMGESNQVDLALSVCRILQEAKQLETRTANAMLKIFLDTSDLPSAETFFENLIEDKYVHPDGITYNTLIALYSHSHQLDQVERIWRMMQSSSITLDSGSLYPYVREAARQRDHSRIDRAVRAMQSDTTHSLQVDKAITLAYSQLGQHKRAMDYLEQMILRGQKPSLEILTVLHKNTLGRGKDAPETKRLLEFCSTHQLPTPRG